MLKTIVVTGGGTGGHLSVAKSLIDEFYNQGCEVIFIGSTKGQDKAWFEHYDKLQHKYFLHTRGVVNQSKFGKILSLWYIFKAMLFSIKVYKKYKVHSVVSVGGFSAAPASFAAFFTNVKFYIHEQNSVMGKLNTITSKYATEVFSSYDKSSTIKDYPINSQFFQHQRVRENIKTIIFLGGSQGATAINNFAMQIAPLLKEKNINIIHQTGKNDLEKVQQFYTKNSIEAICFDFSKNILDYMDKADFAVSRSGASTLWELCAIGMPTLFIPYPYAAANHQYYNAKFLLDDDLCYLCEQDKLNNEILLNILDDNIKIKSEKLIKLIKKDGAKQIVNKILTKF